MLSSCHWPWSLFLTTKSHDIVRCRCNWTHWFDGAVHISHDVVRHLHGTAICMQKLLDDIGRHRPVSLCRAQCEHRFSPGLDARVLVNIPELARISGINNHCWNYGPIDYITRSHTACQIQQKKFKKHACKKLPPTARRSYSLRKRQHGYQLISYLTLNIISIKTVSSIAVSLTLGDYCFLYTIYHIQAIPLPLNPIKIGIFVPVHRSVLC